MHTIVCLGDSLTEGAIGASYVDMLRRALAGEARIINAGVNGDTALNMLRRVGRSVAAHDPDLVLVQAGLNDVGSAYGPSLHRAYYRVVKRVREPQTPRRFAHSYRRLIGALREQTRARIALCTLTTLGENPADPWHPLIDAYSAIVQAIAVQEGMPLIDLRAAFRRAIAADPRPGPPYFILTVPRDALELRLRGLSYADLAARRRYRLLCDGVHLAEAGAALVAETMLPHIGALLAS